ncbi:hypothetical protein LEP1GSC047_1402 [Leptospira inadai serovar Lyme str. 10]|uniref:Uncharacterized protein n=1 Tax=Leptospira inadai serovar Lyme str. 10 TaxID=1049790 RepID=V6HAP6_9LEPT|nr:hypothetical protein LEP1GSC047_1402 [Leptospira inadai serovar Lyme str. 10]
MEVIQDLFSRFGLLDNVARGLTNVLVRIETYPNSIPLQGEFLSVF